MSAPPLQSERQRRNQIAALEKTIAKARARVRDEQKRIQAIEIRMRAEGRKRKLIDDIAAARLRIDTAEGHIRQWQTEIARLKR